MLPKVNVSKRASMDSMPFRTMDFGFNHASPNSSSVLGIPEDSQNFSKLAKRFKVMFRTKPRQL